MSSKCPCNEEKPYGLIANLEKEGSPEPDRVVTLVHGTFAEHAPWMREGRLWRALKPKPDDGSENNSDELPLPPEKCLPGTTLFSTFCWNGFNSHSDRLEAGEVLAKHLRGLTEKFSKAQHFVIGHSHGGNVMLYAMKDESLSDRITGMVTLATPFITVRRRTLHPFVKFGILIIFLLGFFEAFFLADAWSDFRANSANCSTPCAPPQSYPALSIATVALLWLFLTLLSALKYRGEKFGESAVTTALNRLKLTPDDEDAKNKQNDKMLVARPFGDEALMSLVASQFFSWLQNRILTMLSFKVINFWKIGWFSWFWKLLVGIVVLFLIAYTALPYTVGDGKLIAGFDTLLVHFGITNYLISNPLSLVVTIVLAMLALYGLMSLVGLLVLLVAAAPFGLDAMFWNHYFSTTAEASPPGSSRVFLQSPPPVTASFDLAHSGIYTDSDVIDEVVAWIRSREAKVADARASVGK